MTISKHSILSLWAENLKKKNLSSLLDLYHQDAILIPTFSPSPLHHDGGIKNYFDNKFLPVSPEVIECKQEQVATLNTIECHTGLYVFKTESGEQEARFTFIYKEGKILHHHSSVVG
ncbi:hypothetical protein DID78_04060 [Candidatus Marinamargulisbacteria bacterium SCGC AG-343-D04]|nr:hypothetical protein DID78_04060 [Candidatus Marinamargulisbacteria bacterium SCGC AG-343-D04]